MHYKNRTVPRNGATADRENIERLLKSAGFSSVHVKCDQKRIDTLEIMENIANSPEMGRLDNFTYSNSSFSPLSVRSHGQ